ncbi:MAG: WecB/TagA/CpsF family glycosyltransferase [Balneolaceae bacterium]
MVILEKRKKYPVLGVDISPYKEEEFLKVIDDRLKDKSPSSPPLFVVTVNPEIIIHSILDPKFRNILRQSSNINTADGVGISWAIDYLYGKKIDRITGSDSLEKICQLCANNSESVFFYGAMPTVAEKAAEKLKKKIKNLVVEDTYSPERPDIPLEELPFDTQYYLKCSSVVFVGLGAPAQEKWIHENLPKLPKCKLIIGIGGSFDFVAGNVKRAPSWLCKSGLEWVYRLIVQPARWRRMLKLPVFALNVLLLKQSEPKSIEQKAAEPVTAE